MQVIKIKQKSGLTLIEVLLAAFILAIGIVSTLLFFSNAMVSTEFARDVTVATSHAESILEEMQTRKTLSDILTTHWSDWAKAQELHALPQESFNVIFTNNLSNLIDVQATVNWIRKSRVNNVTLRTKIAK